MIVILIILFLQIVCDAMGDAFRLKGRSILHHILESLQLVCFGVLVYMFNDRGFNEWGMLIIYYLSLRFVIFDTIFNIIAGNPISYVGRDTSLYAKFWDIFDSRLHWSTAGSAANTFKYLIALPVMASMIIQMI
jgi:hypothetical protein